MRDCLIIRRLGGLCLLLGRIVFSIIGLNGLLRIDALYGSACGVRDGAAHPDPHGAHSARAGNERNAQSQHDG